LNRATYDPDVGSEARLALGVIVIDCNDPAPLAAFWGGLLGVPVARQEAAWVELQPPMVGGPSIAFQRVPERKMGKNRVHLDLWVDDLVAVTAHAESLGARALGDVVRESDGVFQVMADPEGNEFCLVALPDRS
jgi:hypothetical protein